MNSLLPSTFSPLLTQTSSLRQLLDRTNGASPQRCKVCWTTTTSCEVYWRWTQGCRRRSSLNPKAQVGGRALFSCFTEEKGRWLKWGLNFPFYFLFPGIFFGSFSVSDYDSPPSAALLRFVRMASSWRRARNWIWCYMIRRSWSRREVQKG